MRLLLHPLIAFILTLGWVSRTANAQPDFNSIGRAMTIMLGDNHFGAQRIQQDLNLRILKLYLDELDPDKLYLTQKDVDEFKRKYTGQSRNAFDILLLRSRGMEPARDIYTRFATRVVERTEYIETLTDKAAFDFEGEALVPLSRKRAPWPRDKFGAQFVWQLKIADELLTEQMLQEELMREEEEASPPIEKEKPQETNKEPNTSSEELPSEPAAAPPSSDDTPSSPEDELATPIVSKEKVENSPEPGKPGEPAEPKTEKKTPPSAPTIKREKPRKLIKRRYLRFKEIVQSATNEEIADYFFSAVAQAHDPHSNYLSEKENERFELELRNELTGIGAILKSGPDGSTGVEGITRNGPAHRQGDLQPNDRIVAIDPLNDGNVTDIIYLPIERVIQHILGRKDTSVGLIIENLTAEDSEKRKVVIKRGTIEMPNAAASAEVVKVAQPTGPALVLGWITIPSFYLDFEDGDPSVYRDVKQLVSRLKREEVDGIALDLRNNSGGSLTEVPRLAGLFLPRGPVVQAKTQNGATETLSSKPLKAEYEGPLMVVTDRNSASSSEILAGVLQDYNRALIVGESSTFGKGTVQEKMGIANFLRFMQDPRRAGDLKTTIQKFYRVTGSSTQLHGVIPHIVFPSLNDSLEIGERFLPNALPHENINSARDFRPLPKKELFLPVVAEKSRQRVLASPDFRYIREDLIKAETKRLNNVVTLNRQQRLIASRKEKEESKKRNAERRHRFAKTSALDLQRFHFLRLTLDDLERDKLKTVDRLRDSQAFIIRAENTNSVPNGVPPWPSWLDPVKRETLAILNDLINAIAADAELKELKQAVEAEAAAN